MEDQIFNQLLDFLRNKGFSQEKFVNNCFYTNRRHTRTECVDIWNSFINVAIHMMHGRKTPAQAIEWLVDTAFPLSLS